MRLARRILALLLPLAVACRAEPVAPPGTRIDPGEPGRDTRSVVIVAAGDIACGGEPCRGQIGTARLVRRIDPQVILTLGDHQYPRGTYAGFLASYDPTWGRSLGRTHPTPGNHEYLVPGAAGYFRYFGRRAHRGSGGTYSFDVGRWHVLSIDSGPGSISGEQLRWVREDLRTEGHRCELAYWHHPRWSSGAVHGSDPAFDALWRLLHDLGVDVVLNGHEHHYERFAPLGPTGEPERAGVRAFVVGTGGRSLYGFGEPIPGSEVRIDDRFGVLRMVLSPGEYRWAFVAVGGEVIDRGRDDCRPRAEGPPARGEGPPAPSRGTAGPEPSGCGAPAYQASRCRTPRSGLRRPSRRGGIRG